MISLLLTLFISLFSYCPSVNTIEDHKENIIQVEESHFVTKNAFVVNGFDMYIGLSEFGDYNYYRSFLDNLKQYDTIYTTNITLSDFVGGTPIDVTVAFKAGNMDNGVFNYSWDINRLKIELDTSRTQEDRIIWTFYEVGGAIFKIESRYVYYDGLKLDCIMNNTRVINGSATSGWLNLCFTYNIYNYRTLLPTDYNDMTYSEGYSTGYYDGYGSGYDDGYNYGNGLGYQNGYSAGYNDASNVDATASTIFTGILDVALIPVNVFLTIFNFEVFGINIAGIVSALLTISVVVIIIRFVTGKKDD